MRTEVHLTSPIINQYLMTLKTRWKPRIIGFVGIIGHNLKAIQPFQPLSRLEHLRIIQTTILSTRILTEVLMPSSLPM